MQPLMPPGDGDEAHTRGARVPHPLADAWKDERRRRAIVSTTVRTFVAVAVMIIAFIVIPPGAMVRGDDAVRVIIGVVLLVAVVLWQVHSIYNDPVPEFRAGAALVVLSVLLVLVFAMIYCAIWTADPTSFSEPMTNSTSIYFTVTTLATVGYGDVHAVTQSARWVVTIQMILNLTLVVALGRVLLAAARAGRSRQQATQGAAPAQGGTHHRHHHGGEPPATQ